MFGKVMSLPDALMESYYTLLTDLPPEEFKPLIAADPRNAKVRLARHMIALAARPRGGRRGGGRVGPACTRPAARAARPGEHPETPVEPGEHRLVALLVQGRPGRVQRRGDPQDQGGGGAPRRREGDRLPAGDGPVDRAGRVKLGKRFARVKPA